MYSQMTLIHFINPQNVGKLDNPDGFATVGDPGCGDNVEVYIKIIDDIIYDIKYLVFGCAGSIATSSMASVLVKRKTIEEALKVTEQDVIDALDGLPKDKVHCSNLAIQAIHLAIKNYQDKIQK